jgi:hypothetical protein
MNFLRSLKESLLLGPGRMPEHGNSRVTTENIATNGRNLLAEWNTLQREQHQPNVRLKAMQEILHTCQSKESASTELAKSLSHYNNHVREINLLSLALCAKTLDTCTTLDELSDAASSLLRLRSNSVPATIKLKKLIQLQSQRLQGIQLNKFHSLFEEHLQTTLQNGVSNSLAEELWARFISSSREFLVGYMLVSLLPSAVFESSSSVVEKYQDSLDCALAPMWSRVYFHLSHVRDVGSMDQFVWSFGYAKSFVGLLMNLLGAFGQETVLSQMLPFDYHHASEVQIFEKTVKFMRAHVAIVISKMDRVVTDSNCAMIAEYVLELDSYLNQQIRHQINAVQIQPIFGVFEDAIYLFSVWVRMEVAYFADALKTVFSSASDMYSVEHSLCPSSLLLSANDSSLQCYQCLFESIRLFALGCLRYRNLSSNSLNVVSCHVLEPLLLLVVGSMLARIKSNPNLRSLSRKRATSQRPSNVNRDDIFTSLEQFNNTVGYSCAALQTVGARSTTVTIDNDRYSERWGNLHEWITEKCYEQSFLSPKDLAEHLFVEYDRVDYSRAQKQGKSAPVSDTIEIVCQQLNAMKTVLMSNFSL